MKDKKRIVIAEDNTIVRNGLKALLSQENDFKIIGEAADGRDAIKCVEKLKPDLILMDISMPGIDGLESIKEIKKQNPETRILVLTIHKTEEHICAALQAGANGYIVKDATHAELMVAIKSVLNGKTYISPEVSEIVIEGYLEGKKVCKATSKWDTLTQREREVLKLIGEGYKNKDIANYLCISVKTAEKHRSNLMQKLDIHSIAKLIAYAIEKGLIVK